MLLFFNQALPLLKRLGIDVYGISVQTTGIQMTSAERLGLRFPLLSDARCALAEAIKLPMTLQGRRKRFPVLAVELRNGVIRRILDPEQLVVASR
ncbi:MAG: redoxin domain-containing protein [Luteibacter sp.]|uniref:redoxin domain-containing protein n=1 Tax=Luteibacter TaxID=242605 RepID=UPI00068D8A00